MPLPRFEQIASERLYHLDQIDLSGVNWVGYFPSKSLDATSFLRPKTTWNDVGGVYLILKDTPTDMTAFLAGLEILMPRISPKNNVRLLWIHNPNDAWQNWQYHFIKANSTNHGGVIEWTVAQKTTFKIGTYSYTISEGAIIDLKSDLSTGISFSVGDVTFSGHKDTYQAKGAYAFLPLWGVNAGALNAYLGLLDTDFSNLGCGFQYAATSSMTAQPAKSGTEVLSSPIFNASSGAEVPVKLSFDTLNPLDGSKSFIDFFPFPDSTPPSAIESTFVTKLSFRTTLQPQNHESIEGAKLVFNSLPLNDTSAGESVYANYYLVPSGAFSLHVIGTPTPGSSHQLLCGLSGVEYITFTDGDTLMFYPNKHAGVDIRGTNNENSVSFQLSDSEFYTTSWIMIVPQAGTPKNAYYSEANDAPFFNNEQAASKNLHYYPLSLANLPSTLGDCNFPIFNYNQVINGPTGFGSTDDLIKKFEFQLLNPKRHNKIKEFQSAPSNTSTDTVYALTPQGYVAAFVNGVWTGIQIASSSVTGDSPSRVSINFTCTNTSVGLKPALQNAFLSNQQFLVVSANNNENFSDFVGNVKMSNWSFGQKSNVPPKTPLIQLPETTTPGDYENVMIFKSCESTIKEMAANPELWTSRKEFNDKGSDPDGRFISDWILNYISQAEKMCDNGNGTTSLGDFCNLVNDKYWNGFLLLKVPVVDSASLPVDVQAIVADISGPLYAHHLGNQINHVTPQTVGYQLNSPFFGLIHYVNPKFASEIQHLPPYQPSLQDYKFSVLTLEVVFEKAIETHFANKSMLLMNKFFKDKVVQTDQNGVSGANNVILIGTYHKVGGTSSYTFSTAKGLVTDFYLTSNALCVNRITDVTMNVVKVTTPEVHYIASFEIRGSLGFVYDKNFDLLSYECLSYNGLNLEVTIQQGEENLYSMDTNKFNLEKNQTKAISYGVTIPTGEAMNYARIGSLVAQFPVKLKGFLQNVGSTTHNAKGEKVPNNAPPSQMGYRLLRTATPENTSFTSPSNGEEWYGLEFDIILGGKGSLASGAGISASLILAWTPGGSGYVANASPQFKLSGPDGVSLSFNFEDVLKFGAKDILLNRYIDPPPSDGSKDYFYLVFQSIALSILDISFPPGGTTNLVLMGDTKEEINEVLKPTLSWFGGYAK